MRYGPGHGMLDKTIVKCEYVRKMLARSDGQISVAAACRHFKIMQKTYALYREKHPEAFQNET